MRIVISGTVARFSLNWLSYRKEWRTREGFDAYSMRQLLTESSYINSLADYHICSTIKTLPATLPEPSSMDRGPLITDRGY